MGEPKYIGFTTGTLKKRWGEHCSASKRNSQYVLHKAIRKYGKESFTIEKIYCSTDIEHTLKVMEPKLILEYNTNYQGGNGYNMTMGGEGTIGTVTSKETRQLQSIKAKLRFQNPEERRKTSESTKLAMNIPEVRAKMVGRVMTSDHKNKLRNISLKNSTFVNNNPNIGKNIDYTILKEDGTIETISDLKTFLGLTNRQFGSLLGWSRNQKNRTFLGKVKRTTTHKKYKVKILKIYNKCQNTTKIY